MKRPFRTAITLILLISILSIHPNLYSQPYTISPTLQSYIDRADVLLNQIYYLGQTALSNSINQIDNNETLRLIDLSLGQVVTLERDVISYIASVPPNTMENRNATILHIALHHFNMALGELGFFIRALTDIERFNALQRYFYDIITAIENINQVKQQILV